jgi:ribosomal-protein-alanine N-acetyltransferase
MKDVRIQSERLLLVPLTLEQMRMRRDEEPDEDMKQAYTEMIGSMLALPGREHWAADWLIRLREDGTPVGGIGFKGAPGADGGVELGYGIDEPYRRRGYAAEAVGAMAAWALAQPGVERVLAQTEPNNEISQKVLIKNGFVRNGFGGEGPLFEVRRAQADPEFR